MYPPRQSRHSPEYWNQRYASEAYAFGIEPNAYLRSQVGRLRAGMTALVPGDGEGRNGVWLAQQGLLVTTVDLSETGAAKARRLAADREVILDTQVGDLRTWPWPIGHFDLVASLFLHFDAQVRPEMHRRMLEALRSGGLLIIEGFHPDRFGPNDRPGVLGRQFTPELLRADFAGAEVLELEETTVMLSEGTAHVGEARVVRGVFRKRQNRH